VQSRFVWAAALTLALIACFGLAGAQETKPKSKEASRGPVTGALVDLNSATSDQLQTLPGITEEYARQIIDGRPYAKKTDLIKKKVIPKRVYSQIADHVIAKRTGKKLPE
jgi:competence protein ComEA